MGPGVLLSGRGGAPGRPGGTSYRWASAIDLIYRIKMVLTRASGTVMASSLKQNKFMMCVSVSVTVSLSVRCRCLCVRTRIHEITLPPKRSPRGGHRKKKRVRLYFRFGPGPAPLFISALPVRNILKIQNMLL